MSKPTAAHAFQPSEWAAAAPCVCGKPEADADHLPRVAYVAGKDDHHIDVGDLREGTGTHHPRVRVMSIQGQDAVCKLVRSGKDKWIRLSTLGSVYRLIERSKSPGIDEARRA